MGICYYVCCLLLKGVDLTQREKALTLHSRNKKKSLGEVVIRVNLAGEKVWMIQRIYMNNFYCYI